MSVFQNIKKTIEFFVNVPLFIQGKLKHSKTVLLLSPQYLNYGDHIIALSEAEYIKKFSGELPLDINYTFFDFWKKSAKKAVRKDDILWVTGGGYIGDLWPDSHNSVEKIIETFPDNVIVFAPQTTFFSDVESERAKGFLKKIEEHGKCVFFSREENTYNLLKSMGIDSVVAPDFAFFKEIDFTAPSEEKYISFCIRDDVESVLSPEKARELRKQLEKYGKPFRDILMAKEHCEIPAWSRSFFVKQKLKEYSKSSVVITDRLHGMVFCCVCGVPCVALDNKSKKISGVYNWIKELDYIEYVDSVEKVESAVEKVLKHSDKNANKKKYQILQKTLCDKYDSVFKEYIK